MVSLMGETVWRTVYRDIKAQIDDGRIQPGAPLPTQAGLARDYNVNRHVIRKAICALSEDGLVISWQGRGANVADPRMPYRIGKRTRFSDNVNRNGRRGETCCLGTRQRPASPLVADLLGLTRRDQVLVAEVLRLVDGRPLILARHHFDPQRFPRIVDDIERTGSITKALEATGVLDYLRAETRVETRRPTSSEIATLEISQAQPVLVLTGQNIDSLGRPVEVTETVVRGDRIQLLI